MSAEVDIRPALLVLGQVDDDAHQRPKQFQQRLSRKLASRRPAILKDAHTSPRQSSLPFVWSLDPEAQRRARGWYFANKVQRGTPGGRYASTGGMDAATQVNAHLGDTQGDVALENTAPGAEFVFGLRQVPSHAASGHPRFAEVADKWFGVLSLDVAQAWFGADESEG